MKIIDYFLEQLFQRDIFELNSRILFERIVHEIRDDREFSRVDFRRFQRDHVH